MINNEIIKEYFKDKMNSPSVLTKTVKTLPLQIKDYLDDILHKIPEYQTLNKLVCAVVKNIELKKCQNCGKLLTYDQTKDGKRYCSIKCKGSDLKLKEKTKQTCLKKYCAKAPTCNQDIIIKREINNFKKYGYKNTLSIPQMRQRIKQTCLKKYGGNAPACNQLIKEKMLNTFYTRTGIEHNSILKGFQHILSFKDFVIPLFDIKEYQGLRSRKVYKWKCVKCNKEFESVIPYSSFKEVPRYCPRCPSCYPQIDGYSILEKQLVKYLKTIYDGQIIQNNRTLIVPKELDIVLPELKIAIQFNGLYWHSSQYKNNNYHINKTLECQKIGYRLIHIFQNEWIDKKEIVKAKLKSIICSNQPSIYARKCIIKQINAKQKNQFLNKYHIQGADSANIKLGLFYYNKLIAVMTFCKSRFNKNYQWQLSRYATSKRVIGGASKLLNYFQKTYNPKSIITYADRRYSIGNLYYKLGFKLNHISKPNYYWTKNNVILSRYQTQKHKLKKLLGDTFQQTLSQSQNMLIN